jgi:hypothetical protein
MGKVADRRNNLLTIVAAHPDGLPVEGLLRRAAAPADRRKLLSALRHLAKTGQIRFERPRPTYRHDVRPPRVRPAVTA